MSRDLNTEPPIAQERRRARRFVTSRTARFADACACGPLWPARVVDMSPSGLRLETAHFAAPAQEVEIEIEPQGSGDVLTVRGRVVHSEPAGTNKFAIGMESQFDIRARFGAIARIAAENIAASQPEQVDTATIVCSLPKRAARRTNRHLMELAVLLLVLLLLALGGLLGDRSILTADGNGSSLTHRGGVFTETLVEPNPSRYFAARVSRAGDNIRPKSASAHPISAGPISRESVAPAKLAFFGEPGDVTSSAGADRSSLAPELTSRDLPEHDPALEVRNDTGSDRFDRFSLSRPAANTGPDSRPAVTEPLIDGSSLLIEVDAANYVLHVRNANAIVRTFPIGLGRDGATPLGRFRVDNKIAEPDWYDRGRTVPAGSPHNPLGASWMGLARNGRGTGIGIHPTEDAASVAQPLSRGCIRMTPADAEALFRLVPAGTPVWIHE